MQVALVVLIFVCCLSSVHLYYSSGQAIGANNQQAQSASETAYSAILNAQESGANVTVLVSQFNTGLALEQAGDYIQAVAIFQSVASQSNIAATSARNSQRSSSIIIYALIFAVPAIVGTCTYEGFRAWEKLRVKRILRMQVASKVKPSEKKK